jgi:hypothetical protein
VLRVRTSHSLAFFCHALALPCLVPCIKHQGVSAGKSENAAVEGRSKSLSLVFVFGLSCL